MAIVFGILLIGLATAVAQNGGKQSTNAMNLSAMDYIEIQQLVSRYARAIDTCSNNGYNYADLYASDGWFASSRDGKVGNRLQGRDRLAAAAGGGERGCQKLQRDALHIHVLVNHVIETIPEGVQGTVDLVYPLEAGVGFDPLHSGHVGGYEHVYVKTPEGWRFKSVVHAMPVVTGSVSGDHSRTAVRSPWRDGAPRP